MMEPPSEFGKTAFPAMTFDQRKRRRQQPKPPDWKEAAKDWYENGHDTISTVMKHKLDDIKTSADVSYNYGRLRKWELELGYGGDDKKKYKKNDNNKKNKNNKKKKRKKKLGRENPSRQPVCGCAVDNELAVIARQENWGTCDWRKARERLKGLLHVHGLERLLDVHAFQAVWFFRFFVRHGIGSGFRDVDTFTVSAAAAPAAASLSTSAGSTGMLTEQEDCDESSSSSSSSSSSAEESGDVNEGWSGGESSCEEEDQSSEEESKGADAGTDEDSVGTTEV